MSLDETVYKAYIIAYTLSRFHHTNHNDLLLFSDQKGNPGSGQIWRGSVVDVVPFPRKVLGLSLYHRRGRARHSDWYENSFIIVVYQSEFSKKGFLIDNHYKTIFVSVRMTWSSPIVCMSLNRAIQELQPNSVSTNMKYEQCSAFGGCIIVP